jgi:hypothetical protein
MTPKTTLTDTPDDGMIKALAKKLMDFNKVGSETFDDYPPGHSRFFLRKNFEIKQSVS